jgi:CubicO group peptidase (beta-lactamase class C family)
MENWMRSSRFVAVMLIAAACTPHPSEPSPVPPAPPLATFVDDLMQREMKREGVPGAAFVYVKDGRIVYMKGYGVANVETKTPVDPERTIWRIGSISKTFTATAVLQLADRGLVDLESDVNRYVKLAPVPSTYPIPITVTDLLTHTSGLDEIRPGTQTATAEGVLPLPEFLRPRLVRVRPPGQITAYSTYGITLAGALVEEITHQPIETVLRERIWHPLAMERTSITVPPELAGDVAMGYERKGETLEPQAWEWYHTTPASSINSTAADMARYMIAHLRDDGSPLFSEATARLMHRQHVTMHTRLPGVTLGFFEDYVGDLRVIEHGGNMAGFSAQMTLIPSEHAGFFVITQFEGSQLRDNLKWALLEHLFPAARVRTKPPAPPADFHDRAAAYTGRYVPLTGCQSCTPPSAPFVLQVKSEGDVLVISNRRWVEVDPLVFVREDGGGTIVFRTDEKGRVNWMFSGGFWSFGRVGD